MRSTAAGLLLVLMLGAAEDAVAAEPRRTRTREAQDLYFEGRYAEAVTALDRLLAAPDLDAKTLEVALRYRAYALYLAGRKNEARDTWRQLLRLAPSYAPNPVEVSPEMVRFFAEAGRGFDPSQPPEAPPPTPSVAPIEPTELEPAACHPALCLVPFGVGQLGNEQYAKAAVFFVLEAGLLTLNLATEQVRVKVYRDESGVDDARRQLMIQRTALVLFGATAVLGIADAFWSRGSSGE